jgi:Zn-dependent membrane protease YugP
MFGFIYFDPLYFIMLAPAILLAAVAQWKVKSAYARAGQIPSSSGCSGAQAARRILDDHGLHDVQIEAARGFLSDHYDPRQHVRSGSPPTKPVTLFSRGSGTHRSPSETAWCLSRRQGVPSPSSSL